MNETSERNEPFQLKGGSLTTVVLKLVNPAHDDFFLQLTKRIRQAPSFFKNAPVIIDFDELSPSSAALIDVQKLQAWLRDQDMIPIGVHGGTPEIRESAAKAGLPIVPQARSGRELVARPQEEPPPPPPPSPPMEPRQSLLIKEPVRSGKRIYARDGDLIVLAPVSPGAELLADGHIHIYNTLRGRALAGLGGDRSARIFCQCLQAELVSIAGLYRLAEDIEKSVLDKSVQIFLEADRLRMDVMSC